LFIHTQRLPRARWRKPEAKICLWTEPLYPQVIYARVADRSLRLSTKGEAGDKWVEIAQICAENGNLNPLILLKRLPPGAAPLG
jgi:hypothetical protein